MLQPKQTHTHAKQDPACHSEDLQLRAEQPDKYLSKKKRTPDYKAKI